eukprot:CAMPEP_0181451016 /NCGR_PEP_ID=MMETSP1110-20121109/28473_1 /TAXON_ID=174948 /ORGANISM="Symbiodinium sp., Strain CCMP421" /LENGTH=273 /DNA_ID=CAMNT_0023575253 /DNA_START=60 /DNA_END=879 /DNA_ORIENTATION=-
MARRTALPGLMAVLALLCATQVCFFGYFGRSGLELRAKAEPTKTKPSAPPSPPPPMVVAPKPASASAPVEDAKEAPKPVETNEDPLEALAVSREKMSKELLALAKSMGLETNMTKSDLDVRDLIAQAKTKGAEEMKKLKELDARLVRAELQLMLSESSPELSDFALVTQAAAQGKKLKEAMAKISSLEASLDASEKRANDLLAAMKDMGGKLGVGGFNGLMQFFMSEEAIMKETKDKVTKLASKAESLPRILGSSDPRIAGGKGAVDLHPQVP